MNYLGIDYGEKNIGLAFGDDKLKVAMPIKTVSSIKDIKQIIKERDIQKIIIGLPIGFQGETEQTRKTRNFAKNFKNAILVDERLTSKLANDHSGAAALILQTYFDKM